MAFTFSVFSSSYTVAQHTMFRSIQLVLTVVIYRHNGSPDLKNNFSYFQNIIKESSLFIVNMVKQQQKQQQQQQQKPSSATMILIVYAQRNPNKMITYLHIDTIRMVTLTTLWTRYQMTLNSLTKTTTTSAHILKMIINTCMVSTKWTLSGYDFGPIWFRGMY